MQRTRRRDTPIEVELRRRLHALGFRFRVDAPVITGLRRRADIVFRQHMLAVFVDGCFWHVCPRHATWPRKNAEWWRTKLLANVARDRDTDRRLRKAGWRVVRVWEHQNLDAVTARIARMLRARP